MTDHHPNGMAWRTPPRRDPWAEEEPLVRHFDCDTPSQTRMAVRLEQATRRALDSGRGP